MRFNLDNYETVESRLAKFWEEYPNGQIFTQIYHYDDNKVVFKAEVYRDIADPRPVATGFAEEVRDASPVNRTSFVENAETSAIGRCLSNWKYQSKNAPRPSREEMAKVARMTEVKQHDLAAKFREACTSKGLDADKIAAEAGVDLGSLTEEKMPVLRDAFKKAQEPKPAPETLVEQVTAAFPGAVEEKPEIKDPESPATPSQIAKIRAMLNAKGIQPMGEKIDKCAEIIDRPLTRMENIKKGEASRIIEVLESR